MKLTMNMINAKLDNWLLDNARKHVALSQRAVDGASAKYERLLREHDKDAAALRASFETSLRIGMLQDERTLGEAKRRLEAIEDSVGRVM